MTRDLLRVRGGGPHGLSVLHADREADVGSYTEPNSWVRCR